MTYDTIRKDLKQQQKVEGFTPETALLLAILPKVKTANQWRQLTTVKYYRYGRMSFESYRFYYPSKFLKDLKQFFTEDIEL